MSSSELSISPLWQYYASMTTLLSFFTKASFYNSRNGGLKSMEDWSFFKQEIYFWNLISFSLNVYKI